MINPCPIWSPSPVRRIVRRLVEPLLRLRYRLVDQPRANRTYRTKTALGAIEIFPQVFDPHLFGTGEFLAHSLSPRLVPPGCSVLDMGTGTGIGAIAAAQWAGSVVAIDINPEAVACARANIRAHGLAQRIDVREGDLFAPVSEERFDVVMFNPPYFNGEPHTLFEMALLSTDIAQRFADGLARHLTRSGYALVLLSNRGEMSRFVQALRIHGFTLQVAEEKVTLTERITLFQVLPDYRADAIDPTLVTTSTAMPEMLPR